MCTFFRSRFRFVISVFLVFALFCSKPCFGASGGAGFGSFFSGGMSSMTVATTAVIGVAAAAALVVSAMASKNDDVTVGGTPVILSKSDYNLLSIYQDTGATVGESIAAMGKIYVQNKGDEEVRFEIPEVPEDMEVDSSSSCMQSVSSDGICTFDIRYTSTGQVSGFTNDSFKIQVRGDTSDYITVNKMGIASNTLYDPTIYDTKAHGIDIKAQARSFAKITKGGVEFVYVGTSKGVFKTSDNGATWMAVNAGLSKDVYALHAIGNDLYAAAVNGVDPGGIFKTTDGGASWLRLSDSGLTDTDVTSLASDDTNLYIGVGLDLDGSPGVYSMPIPTVGAGTDWAWLDGSDPQFQIPVHALYYASGSGHDGLYAGFDGLGVYKYNSDTQLWEHIGVQTAGELGGSLMAVRALYLVGGYLYAGEAGTVDAAKVGLVGDGVYRINLATQGSDWASFATGLPANAKVNALHYADGGYLYAGVYEPSGTAVVYKFNTDGGAAWEEDYTAGMDKTVYPGNKELVKVSAIYSTLSKIFVGFGFVAVGPGSVEALPIMTGGIYSRGFSDNSWTLLNNVLLSKDVRALYMNDDKLYAGTYGMGVFKSSDGGANWASVDYDTLGLGSMVQALTFWNDFMYAGTEGGGVYELTTGSWVQKNTGLTNTAVHALGSWEKAGVDSALYAATGDVIGNIGGLGKYSGSAWNMFQADSGQSYAMHDLVGGSGYLYIAGVKSGTDAKVYRFDGNILADMPNIGIAVAADDIYALHAINNELYAGTTSSGVYKVDTSDDGNSWYKVGGTDLNNKAIEDLHPIGDYMFAAGNTFLVSGSKAGVGVYSAGEVYYFDLVKWVYLPKIDLGEEAIKGVYSLYSNGDDRLYAGTSNMGVLKAAFVAPTAAAK